MGNLADWQLILITSLSTGFVTALINKIEIKFLWKAIEDNKREHREMWTEIRKNS